MLFFFTIPKKIINFISNYIIKAKLSIIKLYDEIKLSLFNIPHYLAQFIQASHIVIINKLKEFCIYLAYKSVILKKNYPTIFKFIIKFLQ